MEAASACVAVQPPGWIEGPDSRRIVRALVFGEDEVIEVPDPELREKLRELRDEYQRLSADLTEQDPRNLPFLRLLEQRYPGFSWSTAPGSINWYLRVDGRVPSMLTLLLGLIPEEKVAEAIIRSEIDPFTQRIRSFMQDAEIVQPSHCVLRDVIDWINKGRSGQRLTIVSPVCPDYEVEAGATERHRFTFRGLGSGVGITAERLFAVLPKISDFLRGELGLDVHHVVCPGDFESLSDETNRRMGIDRATFRERVESSCRAIEAAAPAPIVARAFTDLCGGLDRWSEIYAEAVDEVKRGYRDGSIDRAWVERVAKSRAALYDRWYESEKSEGFYIEKVLTQGAEYAAMERVITQYSGYENTLVIGADDHRIAQFYRIFSPLPVIYARRNYE